MLRLIGELLPIPSAIVISFACGYAIRDWILRRRRAAAKLQRRGETQWIEANIAELRDLLSKPEDK